MYSSNCGGEGPQGVKEMWCVVEFGKVLVWTEYEGESVSVRSDMAICKTLKKAREIQSRYGGVVKDMKGNVRD